MSHLARRVRIVAISTIICLTMAQLAVAGRSAWHRHRRARPTPARSYRTTPTTTHNRYQRFPDNDWYYPRYTGAFHYRYFNEMRYPTGDRGLRGTAW